jgi:ZIP family zinc transporter
MVLTALTYGAVPFLLAVGGHAGLLLTIALSLELLFLGLTVSAQILQTSSPRTATTAGLAALLPAGAVAGSAALAGRGPVPISVVLGFATAALLYLVTEELLVEAHETTETPLLTAAFFIGFIAFLTLELNL